MTPRYFFGKASDLGNVAALKQTAFRSLCEEVIMKPILLPVTREALHALPEKEQNERKKVPYLTACTFKSNPSPRTKAYAGPCNLICLDIDRADDAKRLLESHWPTMLKGFSYLVHHTARSTATKPRLRVIVSADAIPPELYPQAVDCIAQRVGVNVTRESLVIVQPMYLPTTFQHDTLPQIILTSHFDGTDFSIADLHPKGEIPPPHQAPDEPPPNPEAPPVADLLHFREPLEGVTIEDAQGAIDCLDPDCSMMQWIEVGAALKHQFQEVGFALWNGWSLKGRKYTTEEDTRYRWNSLKGQTRDRIPVTIRSLFRAARLRGWHNDRLAKEAFAKCLEWLKAEDRSTEELFDRGAEKIAKVTPLLGETQKTTLIAALKDRLKTRGMGASVTAIRRDVEKLENEAERKTMGVPPWAAGLVFVTSGGFFYRQNVDRKFTPDVINLMYTAPSLAEKVPPPTAVYLVKTAQIPQVENLRYDPAKEDKIFSIGGVPYVNIYRPTYAKKDVKRMKEAGDIVEEHTRNLIADPVHQAVWLDFLCYLVQKPGRKIRWALMLQSTKGAGKGWFAEVMQVVLGLSNTTVLMPSGVMDNAFNDWATGRQLVVMNEVRIVGHNRYEVMDKLKPCITDDVISLNVKFENHRSVPNVTNYVLFTNYQDALAIQDDERRYFVLQSPLQRPEQIAKLGGETYFNRIYAQVAENPGGLRAYFEHRAISKDFSPNGRAPVTPYLGEAAVAAASPLAAAVTNVLGDGGHPLVRRDLVSMATLRQTIDASEHVGKYSDQLLSQVLREAGWERSVRCRLNGERHQLWVRGLIGEAKQVAQDRLDLL